MKTEKNKIDKNKSEEPELPAPIETGNDSPVSAQHSLFSTQNYGWAIGCFVVTAVAVFFRFWQLELKPLHHDEGVNSYFLKTLFEDNVYKYDPSNYHGPTLYYIALAFSKIFGLETFSIRASVGVFGVLIVVLTFFLRKYIGTIGSLSAALMLALSPGMVFISRYFIHEIFFVFCSLGLVMGILFFIEGRKAGIFACIWMTLLLLICFLPTSLNLASLLGERNEALVWVLRVSFFVIEASLTFFIMRLLLNWHEGRPIYLLLAAAAAALFFATKETAFVTIGTLLLACLSVWVWRQLYVGAIGKISDSWPEPVTLTWSTLRARLGATTVAEYFLVRGAVTAGAIAIIWLIVKLTYTPDLTPGKPPIDWSNFNYITVIAVIISLLIPAVIWFNRQSKELSKDFVILELSVTFVFLYVGILFFSSFFTYPNGISAAFEAYSFWTKTGTGEHTQNGTWAFVKWLGKVESPILFLSAVGTLIALAKAGHRFALFAGFWAFGLFAAYTIIPYKTPWLALSFILPMCLVAGYGINELATNRDYFQKFLAAAFVLFAIGLLGYQSYSLNFVRYDDDQMPYVYAHTQRGFLGLTRQIEHYAQKSGRGTDASIEIVSPDYWPMPWYTRKYEHAAYPGKIVPVNTAEMIVAKKTDQDEDIQREYASHYKYAGTYPLRPGVELYLLVRRDLADPETKEIDEIDETTGPGMITVDTPVK